MKLGKINCICNGRNTESISGLAEPNKPTRSHLLMLFQWLAAILTLTYYRTRSRHLLRVFQPTATIHVPYRRIFEAPCPRWAEDDLQKSYRHIAARLYIRTGLHVDKRVNRLNWPKVEEVNRFGLNLIRVTKPNPV
jgi:hypothetical protein